MPELLHEMVIDLSRVRPATTCVDYQTVQPQALGASYTKDGLVHTVTGSATLSIVQHPAPPNAFEWVPAQVRYLHVDAFAWLKVELPNPVSWLEVSVAKAAAPAHAPSTNLIDAYVKNAQGWRSGIKTSPISDPYGLVRSYDFSAAEQVVPPGGEFEAKKPPQPLGAITELIVVAAACDVWRICTY